MKISRFSKISKFHFSNFVCLEFCDKNPKIFFIDHPYNCRDSLCHNKRGHSTLRHSPNTSHNNGNPPAEVRVTITIQRRPYNNSQQDYKNGHRDSKNGHRDYKNLLYQLPFIDIKKTQNYINPPAWPWHRAQASNGDPMVLSDYLEEK